MRVSTRLLRLIRLIIGVLFRREDNLRLEQSSLEHVGIKVVAGAELLEACGGQVGRSAGLRTAGGRSSQSALSSP